ncbi:hypothetical protein [Leptospira sp. 'Mane']|uniref:hypothetical protein n=1 Tax=Leptospira sp. 'Mane' TaxID=3387407 RepID=UPI00398AD940
MPPFYKFQLSFLLQKCFILSGLLLLNHCTTVGFHSESKRSSIDFGSPAEIKVCTILETGVSKEDAIGLFDYWNEELNLYSLKVIPVIYKEMERPGFTGGSIFTYLFDMKLESQCDRILYLKGRTFGDMVYEFFTLGIFAGVGLKLEIQGAVDSKTHSRGYIKSKYISTLQVLFTSPESTLVHEGYHLLGCGHQLFMEKCYLQIQKVKALAREKDTEQGFFPSITPEGRQFQNREAIDSEMQ